MSDEPTPDEELDDEAGERVRPSDLLPLALLLVCAVSLFGRL